MMNSNNILDILSKIGIEIEKKEHLFQDPSIENGKMGIALYYYYCYELYRNQKYIEKGEQMIEESVDLLSGISQKGMFNPQYRGDSISNTLSSFGKGLLFIQYQFNHGYNFVDYYKIITEILTVLTLQNLKKRDFDFFSGALSGGHFFINKYYYTRDNQSKDLLLEICTALAETAIYHNENEIYWKAPAYSNRVYIGISHGSAMVINFLTKLYEIGLINSENIEQKLLLTKAVNFVLNRRRNIINGYFPHTFLEEEICKPTQFSLCYGDLGTLFALFNAAKILKNNKLKNEIIKMLSTSCDRKNNLHYTFDATIFYGAAGNYCVFKDLFRRSGDTIYKDTYEYWYSQIITYRDENKNTMASFIDAYQIKDDKHNKSVKLSFGWGLAGIGICLMSELKEDLPPLNEILLTGI